MPCFVSERTKILVLACHSVHNHNKWTGKGYLSRTITTLIINIITWTVVVFIYSYNVIFFVFTPHRLTRVPSVQRKSYWKTEGEHTWKVKLTPWCISVFISLVYKATSARFFGFLKPLDSRDKYFYRAFEETYSLV